MLQPALVLSVEEFPYRYHHTCRPLYTACALWFWILLLRNFADPLEASAGFYDQRVMDVFAGEAQGRIEEFTQQNLVCLSISLCMVLEHGGSPSLHPLSYNGHPACMSAISACSIEPVKAKRRRWR